MSVVSPKRTAPPRRSSCLETCNPSLRSPIYARTNGYLKNWYADIGAHVKQGQLLAVIDAPEVDQQLEQSLSNLNTAKANLALAEITKNRYQGLIKTNAVAQQDVDNAVGTYNANKAIVEADQANVKELQALQSFEKIYAPFDGVVTARNTDIGDLINSGSSGGVKTDLFHIAQPGTLRVYVNVPEEYSQGVKVGMTANLGLAEFPGRNFQGKLVRTAEAINVTTRTLLIEIDVDNPTGTLLTGSYAEVHLKVPTQASTYLLPVNTLIFRSEGLQVGIVKDGKVALSTVTPGHDFGERDRDRRRSQGQRSSHHQPAGFALFPDRKSKLFRQHCRETSNETPSEHGFHRKRMQGSPAAKSAGLRCARDQLDALSDRTTTLLRSKIPSAYKEAADWKPAQPNDQNLGGTWWTMFQDPQLDALELQIDVSNQNLKAAEAQYQQARAVLRYSRADYYPTVQPARQLLGHACRTTPRPRARTLTASPTTTLFCQSTSRIRPTSGDEFAAQWSLTANKRKPARRTWRRSI